MWIKLNRYAHFTWIPILLALLVLQFTLSSGVTQWLLEFYLEAHIRSASEKIASRMEGSSGRIQNLYSQPPVPPELMPRSCCLPSKRSSSFGQAAFLSTCRTGSLPVCAVGLASKEATNAITKSQLQCFQGKYSYNCLGLTTRVNQSSDV